MRYFWKSVVLPVLLAADAKTIVEVGTAAGVHTQQLVSWADAHGAAVHAIDPKPSFDVEGLQRAYPRAFVMHRSLSLEALPHIHEANAVLIDGDHNWHTVYNELKIVDRLPEWPITLLHDIDWPYGRRDLYYDPHNIPDEHRHRHRKAGLVRGKSAPVPGAFNRSLIHADHEGGPRNGVLTAVEDFMDTTARELDLFARSGPGGVGILASREQLSANAALAGVVERVHEMEVAAVLSPRYASRFFD